MRMKLFASFIIHLVFFFVLEGNFSLQFSDLNRTIEIDVIEPQIQPPRSEPVLKNSKQVKVKSKAKPKTKPVIQTKSTQVDASHSDELTRYTMELRGYLQQNMVYPAMARRLKQSGVVKVKLVVNEQGEFVFSTITSPSNFEILNQSTQKLFIDLKKFKPLPKSLGRVWNFIVPIEYYLQK